MIEAKTIGQLVDELIIINMRAWWAQEDIMNLSLSDDVRLKAAEDAQKFNAKRNSLIQAIDRRFGESYTVDSKSYE